MAAFTTIDGGRVPLARVASAMLAALCILVSVGASTAQTDTTLAFLNSVADRLDLQSDECPRALGDLFVQDATLICYRHTFSNFGVFKSAWGTAAVWEGRFSQVDPWLRWDVPSDEVHFSLFHLDGDGILVFFTPGVPGPIAFLINDFAAAQTLAPVPDPARGSGPRRVYDTLRATAESNAFDYRGNDFVLLDRQCRAEDVACTASLPGRSALAVMRSLGLADYGWRIQNIGSDTVYSTVDENLVVILSESRRGVTVTTARLDRGLEGAPHIPGP